MVKDVSKEKKVQDMIKRIVS